MPFEARELTVLLPQLQYQPSAAAIGQWLGKYMSSNFLIGSLLPPHVSCFVLGLEDSIKEAQGPSTAASQTFKFGIVFKLLSLTNGICLNSFVSAPLLVISGLRHSDASPFRAFMILEADLKNGAFS